MANPTRPFRPGGLQTKRLPLEFIDKALYLLCPPVGQAAQPVRRTARPATSGFHIGIEMAYTAPGAACFGVEVTATPQRQGCNSNNCQHNNNQQLFHAFPYFLIIQIQAHAIAAAQMMSNAGYLAANPYPLSHL